MNSLRYQNHQLINLIKSVFFVQNFQFPLLSPRFNLQVKYLVKILYQIKKADLGGLTKILKFFQRDDSKRTIKFGHLLLNSKNRTIYIPERMFVWEKQNRKSRRKNVVWNKRQSRMERLRKNNKSHLFRDSSAILFYHIRGGVCEISMVKRLPRTR